MSTLPASKVPPARKSAPARKKPANGEQPGRKQAGRKQPGFCRFYLTEPLRGRLDAVLSEIDATQDAREHREALSALVVELTNEGLDYYFTGSLVSAKVSFIVQQSSNLGIAGVKQVMAPVIKKVIARLDHAQIVSISASIRTLMA